MIRRTFKCSGCGKDVAFDYNEVVADIMIFFFCERCPWLEQYKLTAARELFRVILRWATE